MDAQILDLVFWWVSYLRDTKNYSNHTVSSYKLDVDNFFSYARNNNDGVYLYEDFLKIDSTQVRGWFFARKSLGTSHRSNLRALSSLKNFIRYLNKYKNFANESILSFNLRSNINSLPKPILLENILLIIDSMNSKFPWIKKRNQALIALLYASGLRISEALDLKISDISQTKSLKICGKGHKERMVPLISSVYLMLKEYIKVSPFNNFEQNYLFCSIRGKKLSRITVAKHLIDIRKKLGLENPVSAHAMRHSFATHLINKNIDLRDIQILLGHSSISTTEIYTKVETSSLLRDYTKFHPRND